MITKMNIVVKVTQGVSFMLQKNWGGVGVQVEKYLIFLCEIQWQLVIFKKLRVGSITHL